MVKRVGSFILSAVLVAGFALSVTLKAAYAYIDLGTASYYIQMLIATGFGALFALKVFWHRIIAQLSRLFTMAKGTKGDLE